jgi:hypothetical protein
MSNTMTIHGEYTLLRTVDYVALEEYRALYLTGHMTNQAHALDSAIAQWPGLSLDIVLGLLQGFIPFYNAGGMARFTY